MATISKGVFHPQFSRWPLMVVGSAFGPFALASISQPRGQCDVRRVVRTLRCASVLWRPSVCLGSRISSRQVGFWLSLTAITEAFSAIFYPFVKPLWIQLFGFCMPYECGRGDSGGWGLLSGSLYGFRLFACFFPLIPSLCVSPRRRKIGQIWIFLWISCLWTEGWVSLSRSFPGIRLLSSYCCAIAIPLPLILSLRACPGHVSTPSEGGHSSIEGSGDWKASFGRCRRDIRRYCRHKLAQFPKHRKFTCFLSARA